MDRISTGIADETVYIDRSGGFTETSLPDGTKVRRDDPDDVYAAIQRWAMKNRKSVKVVDMQKGARMLVDRAGNIDDLDEVSAGKEAQTPLLMRRDYGKKQAAEDPGKDPSKYMESMRNDPDFIGTVRQMLNERLVSSIGEARRLAAEGYTVEELRAIRKGKNMAKGKWASATKHLDILADRLEAHGMREAAEKLDVLANTIESAELVGEPYVVEQLKRAGFEVSRYPGDVERSKSGIKSLTHAESSSWSVSAPSDKAFVVDGVELEELILNVPGAALREETDHFKGTAPDDYRYLVYKPSPNADMKRDLLVAGVNKEQELITKLKALLKTVGMGKKASATDDPTIDEMRAFLKKKFGGLVDQESLESDGAAAMHWFASEYHGGQWSNLYKVLSLGFKPGPSHHSVKDEGEVASDMYDALKEEYIDGKGANK